ncbi:unnamed protein product, partial [Ectocarpus sp. 8 AP-2014]
VAPEAAPGRSEVDMSCYTSDTLAGVLETGIKERYRLQTQVRKLGQELVDLAQESGCSWKKKNNNKKRGHGHRHTPMRVNIVTKGRPSCGQSLRIRKSHFEGTSASSSVVSDNGAGRTITRGGGSGRGRPPFREALDEAKEQLAHVRRQCERSEGALPRRTRLSVHDESAKVSLSHQEIDHNSGNSSSGEEKRSPPKRVASRSGSEESYLSDGYSTRKKTGCKKKTAYLVQLKGPRRKGRPEEKRALPRGTRPGRSKEHGHDDEFRCTWRGMDVSCQEFGRKDEGSGRSNGRGVASPRRVETACVEATHVSSAQEDVEICLKVERKTEGDTTNNTGIISRRGRKQGTAASSSLDRRAKNTVIRSSRSERSEQSAPRASRDCSRPRASLDPCKFEANRGSKESVLDNGYLHARQREGMVGASLRSCGGEERIVEKEAEGKRPSCFESTHHLNGTCTSGIKDEEEGCFAPQTRRGDCDYRGKWNRDHSERITAKEKDVNEDNQQRERWSTRGRVLWATHAEPAARATSTDARIFPRATMRSCSQPVVRPYHGLYARSLQANGIEPAHFRSSRCSCHTTEHRQIDGSVLWPDRENAARTRSPVDGLPDRLEAGRVLDSFERRAELLGKMPPTTLRAKTAWMEKPGDPQYSLQESQDGLLSSFCGTSPDRRFAMYASCAGKAYVRPSKAEATTLLAASSGAWSKPFGPSPMKHSVGARREVEEEVPLFHRRKVAGTGGTSLAEASPCNCQVRGGCSQGIHPSLQTQPLGAESCGHTARVDTACSASCRGNYIPSAGGSARLIGRPAI